MAHAYVWYHMVYVFILDFRETFDEPFHIVNEVNIFRYYQEKKLSKKLEKLNLLTNLRWLV